ncbi:MAG: cell envelope integrity protein CreD, partial [Pseudomonadota bacterium]
RVPRGPRSAVVVSLIPRTRQFRAGRGVGNGAGSNVGAIHVPISEAEARAGFSYGFDITLNGSQSIRFSPAGGDTNVKVSSDWPHPSFDGSFLPDSRTITDSSFDAAWSIPRLARGTSQTERVPTLAALRGPSAFGVKLFQPVRFYSLAQRALKYAVAFIGVVFFAVFIMEVQARRRVHWIQYILVGLALVIFYVLLIGTAEHIGFDAGYTLAAAATATLIGTYFGSVVRSRSRGFALFSLIGTIYALLYLLLRIEDYALLVGSVAAFLCIATVMFVTRNIDWSRGIDFAEPSAQPPATVPAPQS